MNSYYPGGRMLLLAGLLLLVGGCSFNRGFIAPDQPVSGTPASGDIPLYMLGESVDFPYTVAGHVFVDLPIGYADTPLNYTGRIPDDAKEKLKKLAGRIGADAVIGVVNNSFYGWAIATYYASGLAVSRDGRGGEGKDVIACLLPLADAQSDEDLVEYDSEVRIIARHVLTGKGYYVLTPAIGAPSGNSSVEALLESNMAAEACGMQPDILVRIYTDTDQSGSGAFRAAAYSLRSSQYIMGSSTPSDPNYVSAAVFGGLSGYIAAKVSASEVAISKLFAPMPKIAREVK